MTDYRRRVLAAMPGSTERPRCYRFLAPRLYPGIEYSDSAYSAINMACSWLVEHGFASVTPSGVEEVRRMPAGDAALEVEP